MQVRPARPEDAIAACDVLRRSIAELCHADHQGEGAMLDRWLANKTPENVERWIAAGSVLVAEDAGRIVGVAAFSKGGEVTLNYVAPEARLMGVSKALLQAAEDKLRALGHGASKLQSTKTALHFYGAAGYRIDGDPAERQMVKPLP